VYPRPSIAARVAAAWVRRAFRDGATDRVQEFIEAQGTRKVRRPSTGNDVQISTLKSSDDPADQDLFRQLLDKWEAGGDDTDGAGGDSQEIKTREDLRNVVDDFVEDAVRFGLTEAEAREYTKGLAVGDGEEALRQVEKNLQRAIDKRIKENEAKAKGDADRAKAKEDADREAEERRALRTDTEEALAGFRNELYETALAGKLTPAEARRAIEPLVLGADRDTVESVEGAIDEIIAQKMDVARSRDDARRGVESTAEAVEAAREALREAKEGRDKDVIAAAEAELRDAEDRHRSAGLDVLDVESEEYAEYEANARTEIDQAEQEAAAARDEVEAAQARLAELREAGDGGDPGEVARLEGDIRAAERVLGESDARAREIHRDLASREADRSRRLREVSKAQMDASWERAKKNPGMLLFDADGKAQRYNPSRTDAVYDYMMTLLGEKIDERGGIGIDTSGGRSDDKSKGRSKGKGKVLTESELKDRPTLSRRPRNDDGSSPTVDGWGDDRYGPHEFWNIGPNRWSAKNSQGDIATFTTMAGAKQFAKKGSMAVRVASRYLRVEP
jgi:hypothetical protein